MAKLKQTETKPVKIEVSAGYEELTPKNVVKELDNYIIGQNAAKKAVAVALRNRWRRKKLPLELQNEVYPKNIIMIGPTGVGKTEIARRLSSLAKAPFLKIEATKFTEVGYVGRDVESMVRDLVEIGISMVKRERFKQVKEEARRRAEERIVTILLGNQAPPPESDDSEEAERKRRTREKILARFLKGDYNDKEVELEVEKVYPSPMIEIFSNQGIEEMDFNFKDMFKNLVPGKTKLRKFTVPEAFKIVENEEADKLIDMDSVIESGKKRVEETGIIFLDELDKIAYSGAKGAGPDISREGVQRDLLPIIEGSSVNTKYGIVKTDHILFIAAGAFNMSKPSDLIPELQGRFPLRVELKKLDTDDFERILIEPRNALIKQYIELMKTEGIELSFQKSAVRTLAEIAYSINETLENIGARRLHTVLEKVLEDISYEAEDLGGKAISISSKYVRDRLKEIISSEDVSKYIL
ncbi:MAG TPA: ATP-dependent protease ATPase subunit HslU [Firmicutes bacterium]|nr:ATP-dependent protease ATPase subunit HslU [Bacillota bacterium]